MNRLHTPSKNMKSLAALLLAFQAAAAMAPAARAAGQAAQPGPGQASAASFEALDRCLALARAARWGSQLKSAPATLIEQGPFKGVPYASLQSGNYHLKLFGESLSLAGIEMALPEEAAAPAAKAECIAYLQATLKNFLDRAVVRRLDLKQDWLMREELTFEVKSADPAKGHNFWTIAVYDGALLKRARLSDADFAHAVNQREKSLKTALQESTGPAKTSATTGTTPKTGAAPAGAAQTGATTGAAQAGPMRVAPPTVEGTSWLGSETLSGYDKLKFVFGAGRRVAMHDADGVTSGFYEHTGKSITLDFHGGKVLYTGIISNNIMSGTATNSRDNWTWRLTQISGAPVNRAATASTQADADEDSVAFTGSVGTGLRAPERVVHPEIRGQMARKYAISEETIKTMAYAKVRDLAEKMLAEHANIPYSKWCKIPVAQRFEIMIRLFAEQRGITIDEAQQLYIIQEKMHFGFTLTASESRFYDRILKMEGR